MNESTVTTATPVVEETSKMDAMRTYFSNYQTWLTEVAIYGGISFLVGFLFKNFGRYIVGGLLIAVAVIVGLNYAGATAITLQQVTQALGLANIESVQQLYTTATAWATTHVMGAVSVVIGFLLGWKLG